MTAVSQQAVIFVCFSERGWEEPSMRVDAPHPFVYSIGAVYNSPIILQLFKIINSAILDIRTFQRVSLATSQVPSPFTAFDLYLESSYHFGVSGNFNFLM